MRNVAVILAGGVGTRMGGTMPKQFFKVSGKTVLIYTKLWILPLYCNNCSFLFCQKFLL